MAHEVRALTGLPCRNLIGVVASTLDMSDLYKLQFGVGR